MMLNYNDLTDEELYRLIADKNREVVEFVYDKYSPAIYGIILQKVKLRRVADDILTKTFIAFFNSQLHLSSSPITIFMRLHNAACKYIKGRDVLHVSHSSLNIQFPRLFYLNKQG